LLLRYYTYFYNHNTSPQARAYKSCVQLAANVIDPLSFYRFSQYVC